MSTIRMSWALLLGLAMQAACAGTNDDPAGDNAPPGQTPPSQTDPMASAPTPKPGMAMIRAIHASADAPAVDAYVRGSSAPIVTNLAYGQTSTWLEVPNGTYEIELRAAPSKPTDPLAYKSGPLKLDDQAMVSAIAAGLLGSSEASKAFRLVPIVEKFDTVTGGKVRVRAIHAGADAPSVDLDIGNDNPSAPEAPGLVRFADTGPAGVELPAGSLAIGIAKDGGRVTSFTTPELSSGTKLLVIATGLLATLPRERDGFSLLAIGPSGSVGFIKQDPIVHALNAGTDATTIDAFAGNDEVFDNLSYGQLSKPFQMKPGEQQLSFYGTTAGSTRPVGSPVSEASTGMLAAGESYLAIATGVVGAGPFTLIKLREGFDFNAGKAVLRAVNGSPSLAPIDFTVLNGTAVTSVLFTDIPYTKASDEKGVAVSQGTFPLGLVGVGVQTATIKFMFPAQAGQRAFVVAAGALFQANFRLLVVDTAKPSWTVTPVAAF